MRAYAAVIFVAATGCYESRVHVSLRDPADVEVFAPSAPEEAWHPPPRSSWPHATDEVTRAIEQSTLATPETHAIAIANDSGETRTVVVAAYPSGRLDVTAPARTLVDPTSGIDLTVDDTSAVTSDARGVRIDSILRGRSKGARDIGRIDLRVPSSNIVHAEIVSEPDRITGALLLGDSVFLGAGAFVFAFAKGLRSDPASVYGFAPTFGGLAIAAIVSGLWFVCAPEKRVVIVP